MEAYLLALDFGESREWLTLRIRIVEGEQYRVEEIGFAEIEFDRDGRPTRRVGLPEGPYEEDEVRRRLTLKVGEPIFGDRLLRDSDAIQRLYRQSAFIRARVNPRVEAAKEGVGVKVTYEVRTGQRTKVAR